MIAPNPQRTDLTRHDAREVMDSLTRHVLLLDAEGRVVALNRALRLFSESRGAMERPGIGRLEPGASYIPLCDAPTGALPPGRNRFGSGLRTLMEGRGETFEMYGEIAVPGDEAHLFRGRITRLEDADGPYFLVSHEDMGVLGTLTE